MPTFQDTSSPLERYGHNLTMLAQRGAFSPLVGQEAVVNRVFQILQRNNKCNPMLIDFDEARRWAIVVEVVRRMAVGDAPDPLPKQQVIALDYEALFANLSEETFKRREMPRPDLLDQPVEAEPDSEEVLWTMLAEMFRWPALEEWEAPTRVLERLQEIFLAVRQTEGQVVLFIDHFHRLVGGDYQRYLIDAATLLKPTLARREIQLIGACNLTQYRQYVERDAALQRRFQEVCLPEFRLEYW